MPNISFARKMLNCACILLILTFITEKVWSISLCNEYIQNLFIPLLTIIINTQSGSVEENSHTNNTGINDIITGRNNSNENSSDLADVSAQHNISEQANDGNESGLVNNANESEQVNNENEPLKSPEYKQLNNLFKKNN